MSKRIKLAEAMGWEYRKIVGASDKHPGLLVGVSPKRPGMHELPDPWTDANDCNALKEFMQQQGWELNIEWQHYSERRCPHPAVYVHYWNPSTEQHERFDTDLGEPHTISECACKALGIDDDH